MLERHQLAWHLFRCAFEAFLTVAEVDVFTSLVEISRHIVRIVIVIAVNVAARQLSPLDYEPAVLRWL